MAFSLSLSSLSLASCCFWASLSLKLYWFSSFCQICCLRVISRSLLSRSFSAVNWLLSLSSKSTSSLVLVMLLLGISFQQSILLLQSFQTLSSFFQRGSSKSVWLLLSCASWHRILPNSSSSLNSKLCPSEGFLRLSISESSAYLRQSSSSRPHSAMKMESVYSLALCLKYQAITESRNLWRRWKGEAGCCQGLEMGIWCGFSSFWSRLVRRVVLSLLCRPESLNISYSFCRKSIESATQDIFQTSNCKYYQQLSTTYQLSATTTLKPHLIIS